MLLLKFPRVNFWPVFAAIGTTFQIWRGAPGDAIIFVMIGPIAMAFMWTKDSGVLEAPERSITFSARIWSSLFFLTCVWELGSYILSSRAQNDNAYPTISILVGPLLKTNAGKGIFLLIWIGVGMQLLRLWRKK